MKQEASGYPKECVTDEQKQRYIDDYYEKEGIRLDPNKIKYNPGLRSLAKLMLNSLWGMVFLLFVTVTPSLAQLVERGTVVKKVDIPRSPVQFRNGGFAFYRYKVPHGNFELLYTT